MTCAGWQQVPAARRAVPSLTDQADLLEEIAQLLGRDLHLHEVERLQQLVAADQTVLVRVVVVEHVAKRCNTYVMRRACVRVCVIKQLVYACMRPRAYANVQSTTSVLTSSL